MGAPPPYRLSVSGERGRLEALSGTKSGSVAGPAMDIGAFSALYAGARSCRALERAGRLTGGSDEERTLLDSAFASPPAYLLEEF